jgi:hypothetical protein
MTSLVDAESVQTRSAELQKGSFVARYSVRDSVREPKLWRSGMNSNRQFRFWNNLTTTGCSVRQRFDEPALLGVTAGLPAASRGVPKPSPRAVVQKFQNRDWQFEFTSLRQSVLSSDCPTDRVRLAVLRGHVGWLSLCDLDGSGGWFDIREMAMKTYH